jgi:hypothetical protein
MHSSAITQTREVAQIEAAIPHSALMLSDCDALEQLAQARAEIAQLGKELAEAGKALAEKEALILILQDKKARATDRLAVARAKSLEKRRQSPKPIIQHIRDCVAEVLPRAWKVQEESRLYWELWPMLLREMRDAAGEGSRVSLVEYDEDFESCFKRETRAGCSISYSLHADQKIKSMSLETLYEHMVAAIKLT